MIVKRTPLSKKSDHRGWLLEAVSPELTGSQTLGLVVMTTIEPGAFRADHYHQRKTEWFLVLEGQAVLTVTGPDGGNREEVLLDGVEPELVEIPPGHPHKIENRGSTRVYLLAYVNEGFDPGDPDTYYDRKIPAA